jgi:PAS domain S-box-containing protein
LQAVEVAGVLNTPSDGKSTDRSGKMDRALVPGDAPGNEKDTGGKAAQQRLEQATEEWARTFDSIADMVFLIDSDFRLLRVNKAAADALSWKPEELVGKHCYEVVHGTDGPVPYCPHRKTLKTGEAASAEFFEPHLGIHLEASTSPIFNDKGEVTGSVHIAKDITQRKQMEQALRDSERHYHLLTENVADVIWTVDTDLRFTYVSPSVTALLGYAVEELLGKRMAEIMPPASFKLTMEALAEELAPEDGEPKNLGRARILEAELKRKDGSSVWVERKVTVLRNQEGKHVGILGVSRDITERKRAEEALQASEEQWRSLAQNAPNLIIIVNPDGIIQFINRTVSGFTIEEATGKSIYNYIHPQYHHMVKKTIEHVLQTGGPSGYEIEGAGPDGRISWYETQVGPIKHDGQVVAATLITTDITERKRAEEELRESERKYHHLFDNLNDAAFLVDVETGLILETNQQATDMLGRSREEIVGMHQSALHPPGQADKYRQEFAAHIQHGRATDFDAEVIRKDGTVVPVSISASALSMGGRHLILGLFRDISELKKTEAEKKLLEEKAKQASHLASIGEMAAGIAHEVNNPLTGVLGFSEVLMRKDLPEAIRKDVEIIHRGAQRAASILSRMLTFARQRKAERTFTSINEIIETTLELRAYEMEANNIRVTRHLDPELPGTMADATQLQQAFLNIAMNAEMAIRDAHRAGNIWVGTETADSVIRITLKDDGVGIPPENMGKIFDPFFTTREVGKGTGLGLSVCHGIIAEHGGRIYADSEPGRGTRFNVELPIVAGEKPIDLPWPADQPPKVSGARVLVVDDEPLVRELLGQELAGEGYRVETVDGAAAALDRLRGDDYHLVLLDIKMPGMSGIELYQQTCKLKPSLASRVIFITGDTMSPDTREFLSQAKVPYIAKPFNLEKLKGEIRAALRHATIAHQYVR